MDSWLVAAVAAAGFFVKHWRNLSRDRNDFPEFSSAKSRIGKAETGKGPFLELAWGRKLQEDVSSDGREVLGRKVSDSYGLRVAASVSEVNSASGFDSEKMGSLGNQGDCNAISLSSLAPGFLTNENLREDQRGNSAKCSITRMNSFNEPMRKQSFLKTEYSYRHLLRPRDSLDSCLMAQLYMQQVKLEEYILSSLPSPLPTPIMRPLVITDGSQIISRASGDFPNGSNRTGDSKLHSFEKSGYVFGIPPLPKIESLDPPEKLKFKRGNGWDGRLSIPCKRDDEKQFHSQWGPPDGVVLFCIGISIGIMSSYVGNRKEVEKLRGLLKQTQNLVQDLQEELEMKDSLTVKELVNENYNLQKTFDNSFHDIATDSFSLEQNMDNSTKYNGKESFYEKVEEDSESMSKIEAELEAELERLGLNMNVSNMERKLSDLVELDPDFAVDFAEGELRSDMVNGQALIQSVMNEDRSGTSTPHSGNYAVSPQELSLRLHEVIQSRLEERVQELETALENSQRKVKLMESEHRSSWKISNSDWKYSTILESQQTNEELDCMSKPLVMKLSGEALDAYNEAFEELLNVNELEEEEEEEKDDDDDDDDAASDIYWNNHQDELQKFDVNTSWGDKNGVNDSLQPLYGEGRTKEEPQPASRVQELLDLSEDEFGDIDDEMEKQLIQQIVEKTKKGSPLLLISRLGFQERTSTTSVEDSAANLAEAKAAIQAGFRKGNARDRSTPSKINSSGNENRRTDQISISSDSSSSREYFDAPRLFPRARQPSDEEENAKIASSCTPLSMLLIPSLKEVIADDSDGLVMRAVTNSLIHMERTKPGSCEALVCKLLNRLASSKESSMKDMQELAARVFNKGKMTPEDTQNTSMETDSRKKHQHKELPSNSNLSPLARFLLSRWQSQTSRDLNPS